jgi:hypothetical protein
MAITSWRVLDIIEAHRNFGQEGDIETWQQVAIAVARILAGGNLGSLSPDVPRIEPDQRGRSAWGRSLSSGTLTQVE